MGVSGRVIGMWGPWYVLSVICGGLVVWGSVVCGGKWDAGSVVCCAQCFVGAVVWDI